MPTLASAEELRKRLAKGPTPNLVVALGPETVLQEDVLRVVAEGVLGSADSPELLTVQGSNGSSEQDRDAIGRFFDELRTRSMFSARKVVVLRNADAAVKLDPKAFQAWFEAPPDGNTGVILADDLPKALQKRFGDACVVECGGAKGRGAAAAAGSYLRQRAEERGKDLPSREAQHLIGLVGEKLSALEQALEKVLLHAGDAPRITREHIDALVTSGREGSVWAFGDALLAGDGAAAMAEVERCYAEGVPESMGSKKVEHNETAITIRLLSSFATSANRALSIACQLDAGVSPQQVSWGSRPPPTWARKKTTNVIRRRGRAALEVAVLAVEETERALKSGGLSGRIAITRLVLRAGGAR